MCKINNIHQRILLIIFILIIIIREYNRFIYPTLWAEDGAIFLSRTINDGYKSIFTPYAGYLQVIPQIISLLSYYLGGLKYYPVITLSICSIIYAYAFFILSDNSYRWIHENKLIRIFIALSLTVLPGNVEILGNLANIHSVLFIMITFKLISKIDENFSFYTLAMFLLTGLSAGELFLVFPLIVYRLIKLKKLNNSGYVITQYYVFMAIIIFSLIINFIALKQSTIIDHANVSDYLLATIQHLPSIVTTILNRIIFIPFAGSFFVLINKSYWGISASAVVFCVLIMILFGKIILRTIKQNSLLVCAMFCELILIFLTMYVRPDSIGSSYLGKMTEVDTINMRYLIIMTPLSIIFWFIFLWNVSGRTHYLILFACFIVLVNYKGVIYPNFYNTYGYTDPETVHDIWWYSNYENLLHGHNIKIAPIGFSTRLK